MHSSFEYHRNLRHRRSSLARSIALACMFAIPGAYAQSSVDSGNPDNADKKISKVTLGTVQVTADGSQVEIPPAYAGGQVASGGRVGLFGNLDIMDTPFNSINYTAELMLNQQARSVADVVQNDPGVRVSRSSGNFQELYVVRGFPIYSDDMGFNGLYGMLPRQYVAAEFLERVEVFRGANSFLNGAAPTGSGIGGSFNLLPKRASDDDLTRLSAGYEDGGQHFGAVDAGRRFGTNKEVGVRVNALRRDGDISIARTDRELDVLSLGVDYRGKRLRASADLGYQNHVITAPRPSVIPTGGIPPLPKGDSNFAHDWTFTAERVRFGVTRGEYDFDNGTKVWLATGLRDSTEHNVLSSPTSDAVGNTTGRRFDNYRKDKVTTSEVGLRKKFSTGPVNHQLSTTASIFKLDSKNAYAFGAVGGANSNLYHPVQIPPPPANTLLGGILFSPLTTTLIKTSSYALADTLSFADDRVMLTLGARHQTIEQNSYNYNTGALTSGYRESTVTPAAAVVFRPSQQYSIYANYVEGLVKGDVAPASIGGIAVANAGKVFAPFKSKQIEAGAKYDRGNFGATIAVFRINRPNPILVGNVYGQDGEQRNQGVELSWYGEPVVGLRALGGITWLNAETTRTQGGINDGKTVIGVPDSQANFGLEWDVPRIDGLTFDGRLVYTSAQKANVANTWTIPSWTRLDVGARYAFDISNRKVTVRGRVENLANRNYWAAVGGYSPTTNYLVMATPRTFMLSASVDL